MSSAHPSPILSNSAPGADLWYTFLTTGDHCARLTREGFLRGIAGIDPNFTNEATSTTYDSTNQN